MPTTANLLNCLPEVLLGLMQVPVANAAAKTHGTPWCKATHAGKSPLLNCPKRLLLQNDCAKMPRM